jgi:hypothetical protein
MMKVDTEMDDELRPEYDLKGLRVENNTSMASMISSLVRE